jgi:hypothetical protein
MAISKASDQVSHPYCSSNTGCRSFRWGETMSLNFGLQRTYLLLIPQMVYEYGDPVEWYWSGKSKNSQEKPIPVPLCPPQIPHGPTRSRTQPSVVRGRRLTAWAIGMVITGRKCLLCIWDLMQERCWQWSNPRGLYETWNRRLFSLRVYFELKTEEQKSFWRRMSDSYCTENT